MKLRQRWAAVLLAAFCLGSAARARADARNGLGPIPTGRGGVNQAFSDNAEMILDNPSSMVNVEGDGLCELGVATGITTSDYSDSFGNDVNAKVRPAPGPVLGITKTLPGRRWAVGIGLFAPSSFGANYGTLDDPIFGPSVLSSKGNLIKLLPAVAFRATDRLALGASLGVGMSYAAFHGPQYIQSGPLAGTPVLLDTRGTGVAPVGALGMQYQLTEHTRIGATYTEQSDFWLRGATNATLFDGSLIESRFDSKIHVRWPRNLAVGIKHDLSPHRRFAVDAVWYNWSDSYADTTFVMYAPSNPAVQAALAGDGALPLQQNLNLRWTDTVTFRFGYEADLSDTTVFRFGYDYQPGGSPDSTLNPYLTNVLEHVFSVGFSRKLRRAFYNFGYQYAYGPTQSVTTSALVGNQFDGATYQSDAHYATMSLSIPY